MFESLCSRCATEIKKCPWCLTLTPVNGWKAIEKEINYCDNRRKGSYPSYDVIYCPLFTEKKLIQTFTINMRLPGLNDLLNRNYWSRRDVKQEAMNRVIFAAKLAKIKKVTNYPIEIGIYCYEINARRDPDNVQSGAKKIILDALKNADILSGDGRKYISNIICPMPQIDRKNPRIEVMISENAN